LGLPGLAVSDVPDGNPIQVLTRFLDEEPTCTGCSHRTPQVTSGAAK
jgi:hypothetical protein